MSERRRASRRARGDHPRIADRVATTLVFASASASAFERHKLSYIF